MAYGDLALVDAIAYLAREHGVPNRFHASEVSAHSRGGVSTAQAQHIGRLRPLEFKAYDRSDRYRATYKRGWFEVEQINDR